MNTFSDIAINIIMTIIGLACLAIPTIYIHYEIHIFLIMLIIIYGLLSINSIAYMIGCIKCDKDIATVIIAELEATKAWYTNVIPIVMIFVTTYGIYKSMYTVSIIIIAPLLLNKLARIILKNKATLNASSSTT